MTEQGHSPDLDHGHLGPMLWLRQQPRAAFQPDPSKSKQTQVQILSQALLNASMRVG